MADKLGKPPVVLTIAGFDPSSGAGVTADLQVFAAHGLFGTAAITALTVQSTLGVAGVEPVTADTLRRTLKHLVADLPPDGIKIGMLGTVENVRIVVEFLRELSDVVRAGNVPMVLDPVIRSSSGAPLLDEDGLHALRQELLPLLSWITPNYRELCILAGTVTGKLPAAVDLLRADYPGLQIIATGGDELGAPTDVWRTPDGGDREFVGRRVETTSTHGTGCAFSSALLSRLVLGDEPEYAIQGAKLYVEGALLHAPNVGHGAGPLGLLWPLRDC